MFEQRHSKIIVRAAELEDDHVLSSARDTASKPSSFCSSPLPFAAAVANALASSIGFKYSNAARETRKGRKRDDRVKKNKEMP